MISDFGEEQFSRRAESLFVDPSFFVFTPQRFVAFSVRNDTTNSFNEQESIPDKKNARLGRRAARYAVYAHKKLSASSRSSDRTFQHF